MKNKVFKLNAQDPSVSIITKETNSEFAIVCTALVKEVGKPFNEFATLVLTHMKTLPKECRLWIIPEYAMRDADPQEVMDFIHNHLMPLMPEELTMVFGTIEFTLNDHYTNNAIIIHNQQIWFRSKTKILEGEKHNGLEPGNNSEIIKLPFFNLGVPVCADLWDNKLVKKMVKQGADILAVPAWTATADSQTALSEWASLARVESTGKSVIVAVCDHFHAPTNSKFQVAGATQIRSPDGRGYIASTQPVFQSVAFLNLDKVNHAKAEWKKKGLTQSYFFCNVNLPENPVVSENQQSTYSNT